MVQINTKTHNNNNSLSTVLLTYEEIIHYLNTHWSPTKNFVAIHQLEEHFAFPSKQFHIVAISGTNGKSTTIYYTSKLLQEEGLKVGTFSSPHIRSYNERFAINNEHISNIIFTELANEVIQASKDHNINASTKDILTVMAMLFFKNNKVNLALLENAGTYTLDPVLYYDIAIAGVTRIVPNNSHDDTIVAFENIMQKLSPRSFFVSADQNKQNLQIMQAMIQSKGSTWSMPIRKLAPLQYPFEQLHGRCAALAERIAHIYSDNFLYSNEAITLTLLHKTKGLRGRPTLEAKKATISYPKRSMEQFWNTAQTSLPGHFELVQDDKHFVLVDNASNMDALHNIFLGYRLLAYKQQFKNALLVLGCYKDQFEDEVFMKELRYFVKKNSAYIAFCPLQPVVGEHGNQGSWDAQKIATLAKNAKIKSRAYKNFEEAFSAVKTLNEDRKSLIIITGSQAIVSEYEQQKNLQLIEL